MATTGTTVCLRLDDCDVVGRRAGIAEHRSTHLILRCEHAGHLDPKRFVAYGDECVESCVDAS